MRDLSQVGGIGFSLVSYVLVFTAIGYGLDWLLGTRPWLMVVGVFVGAGLGFYVMVKTLTASNEKKKDRAEPGGPRDRRPR